MRGATADPTNILDSLAAKIPDLRVAIAHDYLTQRGGAERVVLALAEAFPDAPIYTSVYNPETTYAEFGHHDVRVSALNRVSTFRRDPRLALPLLPGVWRNTRIEDVDVVVCSSTGWAHGVTTSARKIVYCHNPARWLYQTNDYLRGAHPAVAAGLTLLRPALRRWDHRSAGSAHTYIANSSAVRERIETTYGRRNIEIVHPPVNLRPEHGEAVDGLAPGYFLTVGRRRGYKNSEVITEALRRRPDLHLVVVGGLDTHDLPPNVTVLSDVTDGQLHWLYSNARALLACAFEDFGLTPVEAFSVGTPAICLRAGGYLDSMDEGVTGEFISELSMSSVLEALALFESRTYAANRIVQHGEQFAKARFIQAMTTCAARSAGADYEGHLSGPAVQDWSGTRSSVAS